MRKRIYIAIVGVSLLFGCASQGKWIIQKQKNIVVKKHYTDNKLDFWIRYTYNQQGKITKGEYFVAKGKKPTAIRITTYDKNGYPIKIMHRSIVDLKIKKVENYYIVSYKYLKNRPYLSEKVQVNKSVYAITTNLCERNITKFNYDSRKRIKQVYKIYVGLSGAEITEYYYYGNSDYMQKTVYHKVSLMPGQTFLRETERIIVIYRSNVPWYGKKKYSFKKAIAFFMIWDPIAGKSKLQLDFSNAINTIKSFATIGSLINNERKGVYWRMGEVPDMPEPYIEKPIKWWEL